MIASHYADFRELFASGPSYANDGMRIWTSTELEEPASLPFTSWTQSFPVAFDFSGVDDAVDGVDEWHWYLSQPTEAAPPSGTGSEYETYRVWKITRGETGAAPSRSGKINISLTTYGAGVVAASLQSAATMDRLLRDVHLYARDINNSLFYFWDLHRCAFAASSLV